MTNQQQPLTNAYPNVPRTVLQAEQSRLLYAEIPMSLAVNAMIASILVAAQRSVLNTELIIVWCTLLGATLVLRAVFAVTFRHTQVDKIASENWLTRFRIGTATTGIAWGLASFLLFPVNDIPHQAFLAFAIAGMTAGAVTSLSIDLVSLLAFIVPALVPLIARLLAEEEEIPVEMGIMVTLYLVTLIMIARRTYIGMRENVCLRFEAGTRENDLRESEAQLIKAQEIAQMGSWNLDIPNNNPIWSPQIYRIFGISPGTPLTYETFLGFVHPDDRAKVDTAWNAALRGAPYDIEHRIVIEGQTRWLRERAQIEFDPEFRLLAANGTVHDITARKRAEKELLELNETLEERVKERTRELAHAKELAEASNRAKSAFLSNMSHEIRTPLNSVMGMAHLALRTSLNPKQRDYLEKIHHSGEHLLGVIDDILDFSKIEAGKLSLEAVDFTLGDVMENLANMVGLKAAEKQLRFVVDIDPALSSPLRGDPLRLGQVLINLANNAVKFTGKGEISVRAMKLKESKLEENAADIRARFEVQDSGIGISAEDRLKLFQSFQQADTSTTRQYGGTGLGLAICKQLVELMDGEIGVDSEVGRGSTFWFTVRLGKSSAVPAPQTLEMAVAGQDEALAAIKGAYILLVEDNPFNQQVATELLEEAGMVVCVANNGKEALDLLQNEQFDCVLMDVQMPVMDGFEATRQIRAQPALAGMRVIAMTANAESEDRARCMAAGMDDFLTKPILPELLYATLAKWLAGRRVQAQQRTGERRALADRREQHTAAVAATNPAAATQQANDSAIIDLAVLAKMVSNDPAKIRKFALKFLVSAREGLDEIQAALERRDVSAVAALGHRIKSPAKTVGALGFADLCQKLEQCKRDEDAQQAQGILSQLRALLEQIRAQIDNDLSMPS